MLAGNMAGTGHLKISVMVGLCRWQGRVHWGLLTASNQRFTSVPAAAAARDRQTPKVVVSINEIQDLQSLLSSQGYEVIPSSGAGYKILSVVLGLADLYVTTKPSTYKWDSCAGHAILVSWL